VSDKPPRYASWTAGKLPLRLHLRAERLLARFHLDPVQRLCHRDLARCALLGGYQLDAQSFGGRRGALVGLALNSERLPQGHQHDTEDDRTEEPLRL